MTKREYTDEELIKSIITYTTMKTLVVAFENFEAFEAIYIDMGPVNRETLQKPDTFQAMVNLTNTFAIPTYNDLMLTFGRASEFFNLFVKTTSDDFDACVKMMKEAKDE